MHHYLLYSNGWPLLVLNEMFLDETSSATSAMLTFHRTNRETMKQKQKQTVSRFQCSNPNDETRVVMATKISKDQVLIPIIRDDI